MGKTDNEEIKPFHEISSREMEELVRLYAAEIADVWHSFSEYMQKENDLFTRGLIGRDMYEVEVSRFVHVMKPVLSRLLIEQYYNTGEDSLFDRAMMLNEEVRLQDYTVIDMNRAGRYLEQGDSREPIVIFYQGMFFNLNDPSDIPLRRGARLKIIVRDALEVGRVNRKLVRGRVLLQIDEASLGKKYYEGLCERTHFMQ